MPDLQTLLSYIPFRITLAPTCRINLGIIGDTKITCFDCSKRDAIYYLHNKTSFPICSDCLKRFTDTQDMRRSQIIIHDRPDD